MAPPTKMAVAYRHVFEMRVGDTIYYVGEDPFNPMMATGNGVGKDKALGFEKAIRQALSPLAEAKAAKSSNNQCKRVLVVSFYVR